MDTWRTTYKGIISEEYLNNLNYEKREMKWQEILGQKSDYHKNYVALNEHNKIIGFIDGGVERTKKYNIEAELYAIYILKEYQKKGIGKRLVQRLVMHFKDTGFSTMMVWVAKDNPAVHFYLSFQPELLDKEFDNTLKIEELAYGYRDLDRFSLHN